MKAAIRKVLVFLNGGDWNSYTDDTPSFLDRLDGRGGTS